MILLRKLARGALFFCLFASSAQAQLCAEFGSTASPPQDFNFAHCDTTYRDALIDCHLRTVVNSYGDPVKKLDEAGNQIPVTDDAGTPIYDNDGNVTYINRQERNTRPSCPAKPMPMLKTPLKSPVSDYSPWVYNFIRDPKSPANPYNGIYLAGTAGGPDKTLGMGGPAPVGVSHLSSCVQQLAYDTDPDYGTTDEAKRLRMDWDNCANQYILNYSIYPFQKSHSHMLADPGENADTISLETECQPLEIYTGVEQIENEYNASDYIKVAWDKTLNNPAARKDKTVLNVPGFIKTGLSAIGFSLPAGLIGGTEPHLPSGVKITNNIPPPSPFPDVRLSGIAAEPFEEIVDPTHPYSPRWDYSFTDRDYYTLVKVAGYMTSDAAKTSVYCAGQPTSDESDSQKKADATVKVDVLSFREKPFTEAIASRVAYNYLCKKDEDGDDSYSITSSDGIGVMTSPINPNIPGLSNAWPGSYCWHIEQWSIDEFIAGCVLSIWGLDFDNWCQASTFHAKKDACWRCFGLDGNVDDTDDGGHPPCATHVGGQDQDIKKSCNGMALMLTGSVCLPGALNAFNYRATCDVNPVPDGGLPYGHQSKYDIETVCANLRKPFTPLNKLKMRYYNPADPDNNSLIDGVPEGYRFKQYFGNHMPYPRLWDTGLSLQRANNADRNSQDSNDTTGQYTTIVGVGREGATKNAGSDAQKAHPDERCKLGGWGGDNGLGYSATDLPDSTTGGNDINDDGTFPKPKYLAFYPPTSYKGVSKLSINLPDPMTSWMELKLYQARQDRNMGMSCIPRYEKSVKTGSSENYALSKLGGEWSAIYVTKCKKNQPKVGPIEDCQYLSLADDPTLTDPAKRDSNYTYTFQKKKEAWPLAWRGYMATGTGSAVYNTANLTPSGAARNVAMAVAAGGNQFPQLTGTLTGIPILNGFDNAQPGDIVMMPRGGAPDGTSKPGLAKIGVVEEVRWATTNSKTGKPNLYKDVCTGSATESFKQANCYVRISIQDGGKVPDVCGSTDLWYQPRQLSVYPPEFFDGNASTELKTIGASSSCENTQMSPCQLSGWHTIALYRPSDPQNQLSGCGDPAGCPVKK